MEKLLNLAANVLAKITYTSAVTGAGAASYKGIYQPKTPKTLRK